MISSIEYNKAWSKTHLRSPDTWYTWNILSPYTQRAVRRLEIGAGMSPKFTIKDTYFLDISAHAIAELTKRGGKGIIMGAEEPLPFPKGFFNLVGAFDILEHLKKPETAIQGIAKVLKREGLFIFSVPVNQQYWSSWDVFAGHTQRFEPTRLNTILKRERFCVEHCYVFRTLARKRVFLWFMRLVGSLPLHFPNFLFLIQDYVVSPYAWFWRTFSRSNRCDSLLHIPKDSTNVLIICKKQ